MTTPTINDYIKGFKDTLADSAVVQKGKKMVQDKFESINFNQEDFAVKQAMEALTNLSSEANLANITSRDLLKEIDKLKNAGMDQDAAFNEVLNSATPEEIKALKASLESDNNKQTPIAIASTPPVSASKQEESTAQVVAPIEMSMSDFAGQEDAKQTVNKIITLTKANKRRIDKGLEPIKMSMHCIFKGPPGTGKTTFAHMYAQEIKKLGVLSKGDFIVADRNSLISQFKNESVERTKKLLESAKGSVLFIDEAYNLVVGDNDDEGMKVLNCIIAFMEQERHNFVLILAGYETEMNEFLGHNFGLKSRFPEENCVNFKSFSPEQLMEIVDTTFKKLNFTVEEKAKSLIASKLTVMRQRRDFGNARDCRNLAEKAISQSLSRLGRLTDEEYANLPEGADSHLIYSDFTDDLEDVGTFEEIGEKVQQKVLENKNALNDLVGLAPIKAELDRMAKRLKYAKMRDENNSDSSNLAMVFSGDHGTGKTEVATRLGKILKSMNILSEGNTLIAGRSELVAGYSGQTSGRVKDLFALALGGVLIVKDAYSLIQNGQDSFGDEAMRSLVTEMRANRGKILVIFIGDKEQNEKFIRAAGLQGEIATNLFFPNYTKEEQETLTRRFMSNLKLKADDKVMKKIDSLVAKNSKGNATKIKQIISDLTGNLALRLDTLEEKGVEITQDLLTTLTLEDVPSTGIW